MQQEIEKYSNHIEKVKNLHKGASTKLKSDSSSKMNPQTYVSNFKFINNTGEYGEYVNIPIILLDFFLVFRRRLEGTWTNKKDFKQGRGFEAPL